MVHLLLILLFILIGVVLGVRSRLLTVSGAIAAFVTGFCVVLGLGVNGLIVLGLFFISSSAWSKVKSSKKAKAEELLVKGSQRDWQQVAANGGIAALSSALYYFTDETMWVVAYSICIAAANSDTWASEIGSMSRERPFFIKTWKRIDRGTSGAVSLLGTVAAILGSLLIALSSYILFDLRIFDLLLVFILGFVGNIVDTVLGAYVQATYECRICGLQTEKKQHCQESTKHIKGYAFLDNDAVNFLSGFIAFLLGISIIM